MVAPLGSVARRIRVPAGGSSARPMSTPADATATAAHSLSDALVPQDTQESASREEPWIGPGLPPQVGHANRPPFAAALAFDLSIQSKGLGNIAQDDEKGVAV